MTFTDWLTTHTVVMVFLSKIIAAAIMKKKKKKSQVLGPIFAAMVRVIGPMH